MPMYSSMRERIRRMKTARINAEAKVRKFKTRLKRNDLEGMTEVQKARTIITNAMRRVFGNRRKR